MKAWKLAIPLAGVLTLSLGACDSFTLLSQFQRPQDLTQDLTLSVGKTPLQQGETVDLYPSGGREPYSFAIIADDLAYDAGGGGLGSVAAQRYTAGNSIGRIKLRASDAEGRVADALVTVLPPAPTSFTVGANISHTVQLNWAYSNPAYISGFIILRATSTDGVTYGSFSEIPRLGSGSTSYVDTTTGNPSDKFKYRICAYRASPGGNDYLSPPAPEASTP